MNNNSVIVLQPKQLNALIQDLKNAVVKLDNSIKYKFPSNRDSYEYAKIKTLIFDNCDVLISQATLCNIIQNMHNGKIKTDIYNALKQFISFALNYEETPMPENVLWAPDYNKTFGILVNSISGKFIKWEQLKVEVETQIIQRCPRIIPTDSRIAALSFYGKENHIVRIFDHSGNVVGDVWFGGNPEKNFEHDGLVRIGKAISDTEWEVYQIYQRYSDNSYRLIKSYI